MPEQKNRFTIFTKPWQDESLEELGKIVKKLGFDGVELPVRPGYQVEPESIGSGLKEAVKILGDQGVYIGSVAGSTDKPTIAACGENGVPIIRICVDIDLNIGYMESEKKIRRRFDELIPDLERHQVSIGVQNHCGNAVASAIGIMHLIESYDPKQVSAVLDPAQSAVDGETEEMGLDIVWSHLSLVNLKAASHRQSNHITDIEATWDIIWTTARHSGFSWRKMVSLLQKRGYTGDICLPAEYTRPGGGGQLMGADVIPNVTYDLHYVKALFAADPDDDVDNFRLTDWMSTGEK